MSAKEFHISTILSLTTGRLMPDFDDEAQINHMKELVEFLTGEPCDTIELLYLAGSASEKVRKQLYFVNEISADGINSQTVYDFIDQMEIKYGEYHALDHE